MKTITIAMENNDFVVNNQKWIKENGNLDIMGNVIPEIVLHNRTRLVAGAIEPYLKEKEEFQSCTFSEDGKTCHMHLNVIRVNKGYLNMLDGLINDKIITSYSI